jgi:hypothetical protein
MKTARASKTRRAMKSVKGLWSELDYAQKRSFEIRTGIPVRRGSRPHISRSIDELNRLYAA